MNTEQAELNTLNTRNDYLTGNEWKPAEWWMTFLKQIKKQQNAGNET